MVSSLDAGSSLPLLQAVVALLVYQRPVLLILCLCSVGSKQTFVSVNV